MSSTVQDNQRYTEVARILHWFIAIVIMLQLGGGAYMHELENSKFKFQLYDLHKSAGFLVLILSVFRLLWRFTHPVPALPEGMKGWERLLAHLTHFSFYLLILGVPLLGWLMVSAHPALQDAGATGFFGLFAIPHLPLTASESLAGFFSESHATMAIVTFLLLLLHIVAAMKHHFKDKDDVLSRMTLGPSNGPGHVSGIGWGVVVVAIICLIGSVLVPALGG